MASLTKEQRERYVAELREVRRKLGPFVALQGSEPFRQCDAEIARRLVDLTEIVMRIVTELGKGEV